MLMELIALNDADDDARDGDGGDQSFGIAKLHRVAISSVDYSLVSSICIAAGHMRRLSNGLKGLEPGVRSTSLRKR